VLLGRKTGQYGGDLGRSPVGHLLPVESIWEVVAARLTIANQIAEQDSCRTGRLSEYCKRLDSCPHAPLQRSVGVLICGILFLLLTLPRSAQRSSLPISTTISATNLFLWGFIVRRLNRRCLSDLGPGFCVSVIVGTTLYHRRQSREEQRMAQPTKGCCATLPLSIR
jgi:hypothetical protein